MAYFQVWWHGPIIPELRSSQEDCKFVIRLGLYNRAPSYRKKERRGKKREGNKEQ